MIQVTLHFEVSNSSGRFTYRWLNQHSEALSFAAYSAPLSLCSMDARQSFPVYLKTLLHEELMGSSYSVCQTCLFNKLLFFDLLSEERGGAWQLTSGPK